MYAVACNREKEIFRRAGENEKDESFPDLLKTTERSPLGAAMGHDRTFFNLRKPLEAYLGSAEGAGVN